MEKDKGTDSGVAQTPHNEVNVQGDGNVVVVTGDASSVKIGDIRLDSGESFDSVDFSNGHNNSGVGEAESATAKSCAKLLRAHYLNSSSKIHPTPWFEAGFQLRTTDIYTELEVTSRTERGVESSSSESDFRKRLVSGRCNRILVEGEPGVGKSTFCRKFTLDWASDDLEWAGNFDLLFTLNLRQVTRSGKLIDAIFDQLLPEDTDVDKGHLEHFIKKNQDKVLIFLDGVDELESTWKSDVLKLVKRRFLPQATVVATSRSTERHHLVTDIDGHYIIKGFTLDSVSSYIQKYFESDEGAAESLISMIEADDNIQILTTNPLNAVLLCVLWEDSERALWGNKVTELYRQIIVSIIKRFLKKNDSPVSQCKEIPGDFQSKLSKLGKMAFDGLKEKRSLFRQADLDRNGITQDMLEAGFLHQEYGASRVENCKYWVFLHKTFQEYTAAYYLHRSGEAHDKSILTAVVESEELHNVCLFLAGLLSSAADELFEAFTNVLSTTKPNTEYFSRLIQLALTCLHESGNRIDFARQLAPAILSEPNTLSIFSARCTSQFFSGLTTVIAEYVRTNPDDGAASKLKNLVFNYPYSFTDMEPQLFDTLCLASHLERFVISIPHSLESMTASVIRHNKCLRDVGLQIEGECPSKFLPHVSEALAASTSLRYLRLSINVDESKHHNAISVPISQCLEHFSLYGRRQAETLFRDIAKDLSDHKNLKSLSTNFASSFLSAERREALANVILQSKSLSKLSLNTERRLNSGHGTPESSPSPSRRSYRDLSSHPMFSGARRVKQEQHREQATASFSSALEKSEFLRYVVVKHFGDDRDLLSVFDSIKCNGSIRHLIIVTEHLKPHILHEMFTRLGEKPDLDLVGAVSENELPLSNPDPPVAKSFRKCEFASKLPPDEGPIPGFPGFYIWEQWEVWFKEVTAFESEGERSPVEIDKYAKERLLSYILPPLTAGFHVNVWERIESASPQTDR